MSTPPPAVPRHLIIFGRPGSGKSSLAERLRRDEGYVLVRTGEMLRDAVRRGGPLAERIEGHLSQGDLVPDLLILELLRVNLESPREHKLIFDGFPRTLGQYTLLETFEEKLGFAIECFLEISLTRESAIRRMNGRRVCPKCGSTYHLVSKAPRLPGLCDLDGETLIIRTDDSVEVITFRQNVYDEHVPAILDRVRALMPDLLRSVDGDQSLEDVYRETRFVLGLPAKDLSRCR